MVILTTNGLTAEVSGKQVLKGLNFQIEKGSLNLLIGANGSGKSSLTSVLMGNKQYTVTDGEVEFEGQNLLEMDASQRAKAGLFVAWQQPVAIPGVSVFTLCKTAYESIGKEIESVVSFKNNLVELLERVGLPTEYVGRSVNEGFSGGEKKRLELLQLLLVKPKLAILDEIDSGLDEKGRELMVKIVEESRQEGMTLIVISHYKDLLKMIKADKVWEMKNGRIQPRV